MVREAWDKLRDGLPCDPYFVTLRCLEWTGWNLLSRMQKDPNLSQMPIAMLTSGACRSTENGNSAGAGGYFTKPYVEESPLDGAQRMPATVGTSGSIV